MNSVAIALGSNLGDRRAHLACALDHLRRHLHDLVVSTIRETAPVGVGPQPAFLNGVVIGRTALGPRALLGVLLDIEQACGRQRPHPGAARTLDLDLILFAAAIIDEPGLRVPHPRFRDRAFVLEPLAEVAPGWVDPESGATIADLLRALPRT